MADSKSRPAKKRTAAPKSKPRARPFPLKRYKSWTLTILAASVLIFGNWFAHQPAAERNRYGELTPFIESVGLITAGLTDTLGLTGRDASVPYLSEVPVRGPLPFGEPEITDRNKAPSWVLLKRKGYWSAWVPELRHPLWVAYAVPVRKLSNYPQPRPSGFDKDTAAKNSPSSGDYTGSGYDRGHMAPNYVIATRYGRAAQLETFLMSNISPQRPGLNRGPWKDLEKIVADDLSAAGDIVYVITGAVPNRRQKLKKTTVRIPVGFYKIIAAVHRGRLRVISAYMPQDIRSDKHPRYTLCSVDMIEALTGLNFFPTLSEERQHTLESVEPTRFWPLWSLFK